MYLEYSTPKPIHQLPELVPAPSGLASPLRKWFTTNAKSLRIRRFLYEKATKDVWMYVFMTDEAAVRFNLDETFSLMFFTPNIHWPLEWEG